MEREIWFEKEIIHYQQFQETISHVLTYTCRKKLII